MTTTERRPGLIVLTIGLGVGVLCDGLLRATPWGLNATLVAASILAAIVLLQRHGGTRAGGRAVACAAAAVAATAGFIWWDATVLKALDVAVVAVALGLLASERAGQTAPRTLAACVSRLSGTAAHTLYGTPVLIASDVPWREIGVASLFSGLFAVARGVVLATPLVFVFAVLLARADAVFAAGLAALLDVDVFTVAGHVLVALACGWLAAGLLRAAACRPAPWHEVPPRPGWLRLGAIEVTVVLGLLDVLFGVFVWVQLRYLFGGAPWVLGASGLSYAEYARRGFFELVAVTALVLPLLLVAQWILRPRSRGEARVFAGLAGVQVALLLVMLVSAFERMRLYRYEYGLTQLRFYTSAFMMWLGLLLVWFVLTILRGRREAFARGVMASAVAAVVGLHAVDPERRIVEANLELPRGFDAFYAASLSADAVPALLEAAPSLEDWERQKVAWDLLGRWTSGDADLRTWSVPRARARRLVRDAEPMLRAAVQSRADAR